MLSQVSLITIYSKQKTIRLWATSGQEALEQADICLLNVNSTGCEILKNLVLPGIVNNALLFLLSYS